MTDWIAPDATASAALLSSGHAQPRELIGAALAAVGDLDPLLNALVVSRDELPDVSSSSTGPLSGVPFLLHDAGAVLAGMPLFAGSGLLRSLAWRAPADTELGARFRRAGLVPIGKTSLPEFGSQPTTQPLAFGPTRNPWDLERSAGGSSGGSAAAVAAGIVPIAHGSDIGGAIRIPAAWCGVVGLKPSRGRVPIAPVVDPNRVEHVLTRTVRDAALALDAVAGLAPDDPYALAAPEHSFADALETDPGRLRIGLMNAVDDPAVGVHPACVDAVLEAGSLLADLGHEVELGGPPRLYDEEFATHTFVTASVELKHVLDEVAVAVGRPLSLADVEPYTWALALVGALEEGASYAASQTWQRAYAARVSTWWSDGHDILVTPTTAEPAPLLEELVPPADDPLSILPRFRRAWCFTSPFNVTGQPAITLPLGCTEARLPVGVQLVAPLGREELLIALAAQLEWARPWDERHPPVSVWESRSTRRPDAALPAGREQARRVETARA